MSFLLCVCGLVNHNYGTLTVIKLDTMETTKGGRIAPVTDDADQVRVTCTRNDLYHVT